MQSINSLVPQAAGRVIRGSCRTPVQALIAWVVLALWIFIPLSAPAITVSGNLNVDTVWSMSQSPVILLGDVVLDQDATLTIEPGVEVRMAPSASFTLQKGAVRAVGTQSQPIFITSAKSSPAPGDWGVWRFSEGTRSPQTQWDHVSVEYGSGIVIQKSSPGLNNVTVRFHNGPAIRADLESSPAGQGLRAEGNQLNAVALPAGVIVGQVAWGLVGIPYFVEQGLVEVGAAQMAIDPAEVNLAPSSSWPMRLVLRQPVPTGGRVVSLSSNGSGSIELPATVNLPEGALGAEFSVSSSGAKSASTSVITAAHPDLGIAAAKVQVYVPSVLELSMRQSTLLVNSPYAVTASLTIPAPAGGLTVQVVSSPAGALQHPSTVVVPEGETSAEFIVQGRAPHSNASLSAQAVGYSSRGALSLQFVQQVQIGMEQNQNAIVVGESFDVKFGPVTPPAPRGGLRVQVTTSNPGVVAVSAGETVVAGQEEYPSNVPTVQYAGIGPGTARIQVSGPGVALAFRDIAVRKRTVLSLQSVSENGKFTLGQGLSGKVRIGRQIDMDSYHGSSDLWVILRCEDTAICSRKAVYIPAGVSFVEVAMTGGQTGTTQMLVEAQYAATATADVTVVKPQWVWQSDWSDDSTSEEPTLDTSRYMSLRHGFRICLSVPEAAPDNRQKLEGAALVMNLGLRDQNPVGLVSAFYDQLSGGAPITEARIQSGTACTERLYVGEATQRGRYRIGLTGPGGAASQSEPVRVRADHQIEIVAACGDCAAMVVVQGFRAKFRVYATHLGAPVPPSSPIDVRLQCLDSAICTSQPAVEIGPDEEALVEVAGHAPGEAVLEATVTRPSSLYPEAGVGKIWVASPSLSFDSQAWETPVTDAAAGKATSYPICISVPGWGVRSYPIANLQVELLSSNPAVARPAQAAMTWPAGVACISVGMQFVSAGTAQLTVKLPGVPAHSMRFEVQP